MSALEILQQYRIAKHEVAQIECRIRELNDLCDNITQVITGDRVQISPVGDRIGRIVADKADAVAELEEALERAYAVQKEVTNLINRIDNTEYRWVLALRYIGCMTYMQMAHEMDRSYKWTWELHRRALRACEKMVSSSADPNNKTQNNNIRLTKETPDIS